MSFGSSIGDIVVLGQLAWKVCKSYRDAPENFRKIYHEALSLHAVLKEVEENISTRNLSETSQARLKIIGDGCHEVLKDLQNLVDKYDSLGTQSKRTWARLQWNP